MVATYISNLKLFCYAQANGSTFLPANNPANIIHDGCGLFYQNSLPLSVLICPLTNRL